MPSKRKNTDRENMPPPGHTRSAKRTKKPASRSDEIAMRDIGNSTNESQSQNVTEICGPLSTIFERAQENTALHGRYCQELNNIYARVIKIYQI